MSATPHSFTAAAVLGRLHGLDARTLEVWVASEWVRPVRRNGEPLFAEADVARLNLILELRDELELGEPAIPVVLSLIDQLHDSRRQMLRLRDALGDLPDENLRDLAKRLADAERS